MRYSFFLVLLALVLVFSGCNDFQQPKSEKVIARAYNNYLYEDDLSELNLETLSEEDSINRLNAFVNKWLTDQVLIHEAENNLSEDEELEEKVKSFRNSLLVFDYQKAILKQNLDTIISEAEIQDYYERYGADFRLNHNIIKARFLKLPAKPKNLKQVKQFLKDGEDEDIRALSDYAQRNAVLYHLNAEVWISMDDLANEIPIVIKSSTLKKESLIQEKIEDHLYLIMIYDFLKKGEKSPVEFELDRIKTNILNQRKLDLIEKMKEDLLKKASSNSSVQVF